MRKIFSIILNLFFVFNLSACYYNPPEGYNKEHHTYEEILEFAKSLDSNAVVSKEYTDTIIDAWNREFREYPAVINGIECHVSSVGDMVWNEGFLAGEFAEQYYIIDTDYDYYLLRKITNAKQPTWNISNDDLNVRYNWNDMVLVETDISKNGKLSADELEMIWQQAYEIYKEYSKHPIRKVAQFGVAAPSKSYTDGSFTDAYIKISRCYFYDFSEKGKSDFFKMYDEKWALLESGLPIRD